MRILIGFRSVLSLNWDARLFLHPVNFLFRRCEINSFRRVILRHGTARQTRINRQENDGVGNEKKRRRKEDKKWGMRNLIAFRSSLSFNWDDRLSLHPVNILFQKYVINTFSHASWSGLCILCEYRLLSSDRYVLPLLASYAQFQQPLDVYLSDPVCWHISQSLIVQRRYQLRYMIDNR